jgi:hypothetical protein
MFNPSVDRMEYVAAVSNGLGYCETVEELLNVEAPPCAPTCLAAALRDAGLASAKSLELH